MLKNVILFSSMVTIIVITLLTGCAKEINEIKENTETSILTEVAEIPKTIDEIMEEKKDVKPTSLSTSELITNALLNHYNNQFGNTNAKYKTTGYKMFVIEDVSPQEKKAYGFASYAEYDIKNGETVNTAGSGPTAIAITFSIDGKNSKIDFEALTDSDLNSVEFKNIFPKNVQEKILARNQIDIDEVEKKQQNMLKDLMKGASNK